MNIESEMKADAGDNIGLKSAIVLFRQSWKLITVFGILGLVLSGIYGFTKPTQYEATLQIKMAQYISNNNIAYIEQPAELIERLKMPTVYTDDVLRECGVTANDADGPYINGLFKASVIKGVGDAIEIKLRSNKPEGAKSCTGALLKIISSQQQSMTDDLLNGKQTQLDRMQMTLLQEEKQLESAKQSEKGGIAYLTSLSALTLLRTGIDRLNDEIFFARLHPTKLMTPIYVSSKPVSNKIQLFLFLGIFGGLVLGVVIAALQNQFKKKSEPQ